MKIPNLKIIAFTRVFTLLLLFLFAWFVTQGFQLNPFQRINIHILH